MCQCALPFTGSLLLTWVMVFLAGRARKGPTLHECFLMHAVARLTLQEALPNIQASWVKMGPERAAALMHAGCNDMGVHHPCSGWEVWHCFAQLT